MIRPILTLAIAATLLAAPAASAQTPPDIDCDGSRSFAAYQAILRADRSDPHGLDADNDGIACDAFAPAGYSPPAPAAPNTLRREVGYDSATGRTYELAPYYSSQVLGVTSITPPRTGDAGLR